MDQPANIEPAHPGDDGRMPLIDHLKELRIRLIRSIIAIGVGFIISYGFVNRVFELLTQPLREVNSKVLLIGTGIGEAFFTEIKVALVAGLFLASPAVLYEVWRFIAPGLYDTERKMARPFVLFTTIFFLAGGYFCWAVVLKLGYAFFLRQYADIGVTPTLRISEYLDFSAKLLLAFAITFEMPAFAFFLTRFGIIDYRWLRRQSRYAIVVIFIVAAALTPPDFVSMILLSIPLLALYALSIVVSYLFRHEPEELESPAGSDAPVP